jgi:hypothetical protein
MSPTLTVIVVIGASVLSSTAGLLWVRRLVPLSFLQTHHEVAGFFISVLSAIYAEWNQQPLGGLIGDGTSPDRMIASRWMSGWLGRAADHC